MMENNNWSGFDSVEMEETEKEKRTLQCQTLAEIMALYRNNPSMVNISKPSPLSPTIGTDNTVSGIFDMMTENSADGSQNTNHQNVMKQRVGRNRTTNYMRNNRLIIHGA